MERIILARHGESELSARGLVNGDPAAAGPLTPAGAEQARRLGRLLAGDRLDLCVVTEFVRVQETADLALAGRAVPRLVLPELNDIVAGAFEGGPLGELRAWAGTHGPAEETPGGGESRATVAARFARGFRAILARPERAALVVAHSLPIAYALLAAEGRDPEPLVQQVPYAEPYRLGAETLAAAAGRLAAWAARPVWPPGAS